MSERHATAATMVLDLRTPLARLSLAAQRFAREAVRPADQALAAGMQDAVLEIDTRIDRILPLLAPADPTLTTNRSAALPVFEQLQERLQPALEAQGIALDLMPPTETFEVDSHAIRRLSATLVHAGAAWVGDGGRLELRLVSGTPAAPALELTCIRDAGGSHASSLPRPDFVIPPDLQALAEQFVLAPDPPNRIRISVSLEVPA